MYHRSKMQLYVSEILLSKTALAISMPAVTSYSSPICIRYTSSPNILVLIRLFSASKCPDFFGSITPTVFKNKKNDVLFAFFMRNARSSPMIRVC
jgi:hypothetical protein